MANGWKGGFERTKWIDGREESMPALIRTETIDHVVKAWSEDAVMIQLAKSLNVPKACMPGRGTLEVILATLTLESTSSNCLNASFVRFEDYVEMVTVELQNIDNELDVFYVDELGGIGTTHPSAVSVRQMRAEIQSMLAMAKEYRNYGKYELVKHIKVDHHVMEDLHCGCHLIGGTCSFIGTVNQPANHQHTKSECGGCLRFHRFPTRLYSFVNDIMNRCEKEFGWHSSFARPADDVDTRVNPGTRFGPATFIMDRVKQVC